MKDLIDFHSNNKLVLLTYSQAAMGQMGRLTANPEIARPAEIFSQYRALLVRALAKAPAIPRR